MGIMEDYFLINFPITFDEFLKYSEKRQIVINILYITFDFVYKTFNIEET